MNLVIDETHDPAVVSWIESANGHSEFPLQNLAFGVFSMPGEKSRGGVAIGDFILDIDQLARSGLLQGVAQQAGEAASGSTLNAFLASGLDARRALRRALFALLRAEGRVNIVERMLIPAGEATLHAPAAVGGYTDFFAGIHHARNAGSLSRPDNPLLPNYKYVPVGYHGRASSIRISGEPVRRPRGQRKLPGSEIPEFGPSEKLDYELELGLWVGQENRLGEPVGIEAAAGHLAGICLLNDWSARDLQAWEYQPLGPFLAKNFMTTISPWIVTLEALAPYRVPQPSRPVGDPPPLPYLMNDEDQRRGAFAIELEVFIQTRQMRATGVSPHRLSRGSATDLYWTPAQLLAHHTSNGCDLHPGDLLGTGTISSAAPAGVGSLLEHTANGQRAIRLPTSETRTFLEDGDEIWLQAHAIVEGRVKIGFGECRGRIVQAPRPVG